jgi:ATP-dependent DNA helicase DinG
VIKKLLKFFPKDYEPSTGQIDIINRVDEAFSTGYKFCIVSAPTGTGKSFLSNTLANASNKPTKVFEELVMSYEAYKQDFTGNYINQVECENEPPFGSFTLTITKALQDQYLNLFKESKILKGKNNYTCELDHISPVDAAPCLLAPKIKEQCWDCNKCTYYNTRNSTLLSTHSILNYKMFLHLPSHLKRKNYIICDEASELESELVKMYSLYLEFQKIKKLGINTQRPKSYDSDTIFEWLTLLSVDISSYLDNLIKKQNKNSNIVIGEKIRISSLKNLYWQINQTLLEWNNCQWIIDSPDKGAVTITPLKVDTLSRNIFNYADQIVLMSATIIDHKKYAQSLGISNYKYIEIKSNFDPKQSPIYISNSNSINYNNKNIVLPKIAKQILELCDLYKNEKGIIHTHSLEITNLIKKYLKEKRFLFRDDFQSNDDILNKHYTQKEPTVLVSPSLTHGVDLKDDLARFCIIIKLPYPPLSNKRIKKIFDIDKEWYENQMLNILVQMCGRATRSKKDYSNTYILDGNGFRVLPKVKNKLPEHFFSRIN